MGGKAIIHINGVEYEIAARNVDKDGPVFQNLQARIDRMVKGSDTQVQQFDVVIQGHWAQLLVRPAEVVSAAIAFVPA